MSFTYAQLKQAIQDYTENDETTFVANLPIFIRNAEERILKTIQLNLFRKNATANFTASQQYLASPSDFLAPFSLSYTDGDGDKNFLLFKDVNFIQEFNPDSSVEGAPRYYAVFDIDNFIISPTPDSAYVAELHYYYRPDSLTNKAEDGTTWLSENATLAMLYGSLIEAYPEEVAELCVNRLISIGDNSHPALQAQARAFRDRMLAVVTQYIKMGIEQDRATISTELTKAGYQQIADQLRRL